MKYIFDLYWFNSGGSNRLKLTPSDYQTEPKGGWGNWTAEHNVNFMLDMIKSKEAFTLVGNPNNLIGQAYNAGKTGTRCMVGAEVLLLLSAGYKAWIFETEKRRDSEKLIYFVPSLESAMPELSLVEEAIKFLNSKGTSAKFWTEKRKQDYITLISQTALPK